MGLFTDEAYLFTDMMSKGFLDGGGVQYKFASKLVEPITLEEAPHDTLLLVISSFENGDPNEKIIGTDVLMLKGSVIMKLGDSAKNKTLTDCPGKQWLNNPMLYCDKAYFPSGHMGIKNIEKVDEVMDGSAHYHSEEGLVIPIKEILYQGKRIFQLNTVTTSAGAKDSSIYSKRPPQFESPLDFNDLTNGVAKHILEATKSTISNEDNEATKVEVLVYSECGNVYSEFWYPQEDNRLMIQRTISSSKMRNIKDIKVVKKAKEEVLV